MRSRLTKGSGDVHRLCSNVRVWVPSNSSGEGGRTMIEALRQLAAICLMLVAATAVVPASAQANNCAQQCVAQENACRRATKDSPSCSAQATRCLQACRTKR